MPPTNTSKICILLSVGVSLLLIYLWASDSIETEKLYSYNGGFYYTIWQSEPTSKCLNVAPNYLNLNEKERLLKSELTIEKQCNLTEAHISFSITDLVDFQIENHTNLTITNSTENGILLLNISSRNMGLYQTYPLTFYFKINHDAYSYYRVGGESVKIGEFTLIFDNSIFKGHICEGEDCFNIIEGDAREEALWKGNTKTFRINSANGPLIRFNSKSRGWNLALKLLDAFILGSITVILYEILNIWFIHKLLKDN